MQETGPTPFRPYLRRLECLTACRCHSRGSAFFSVILRSWVWVRPGSWSPTSRTVVQRSSTWANQAVVIISIISKLRKFRYTRWLSCMKICIIIAATIRWNFMCEDLYVFLGHVCFTIKRNKLIDSSRYSLNNRMKEF